MRIAPKKILVCFIGFLVTCNIFGAKPSGGPPPPNPRKGPPLGGGFPIDSEIYLMVIVAILFGIYVFIYKESGSKKKKHLK